jgi:hypothetical protein
MTENDKVRRTWMDTVMAYFKTLSQHWSQWIEKYHNMTQTRQTISVPRIEDPNPELSEYEAGILTSQPSSSV